ncbi:type II toxin-antitoxin system RelE family toxin [Calothrix sp. 336/3]|uniref:type II toxin-antitoxin system RelE family toxin n=1 Tax=Calothrix sp. 336/3 TaxID=1337936 RepID=UPI0009E3424F|nr:type II toxin-antitoxin system RelE/ParE family toxin [Calothrix sp. 336/3]
MNVEFRKSFEKDLRKILDENLLQRIQAVIEEIEKAESLGDINNIKKLKSSDGDYYRIRIGDYRIGLIISDDLCAKRGQDARTTMILNFLLYNLAAHQLRRLLFISSLRLLN